MQIVIHNKMSKPECKHGYHIAHMKFKAIEKMLGTDYKNSSKYFV